MLSLLHENAYISIVRISKSDMSIIPLLPPIGRSQSTAACLSALLFLSLWYPSADATLSDLPLISGETLRLSLNDRMQFKYFSNIYPSYFYYF